MLSDGEQAALKELLINEAWAVYVQPAARAHACHSREHAIRFADAIRRANIVHPERGELQLAEAYVLCYGIVWTEP